jgi:hypothetical protein
MGHYARAAERAPHAPAEHLVRTITNEYREMPGLRLTRTQFQRLWHLDPQQCDAIVDDLVGRAVLVEGADGRLGPRSA